MEIQSLILIKEGNLNEVLKRQFKHDKVIRILLRGVNKNGTVRSLFDKTIGISLEGFSEEYLLSKEEDGIILESNFWVDCKKIEAL